MNRPHFQIGGRSAAGFSGPPAARHSMLPAQYGLSDSWSHQGTEIENLRRLMNYDQPLSDQRLAELRDRVAKGEFLTRAAAEATAGRLVDDGFDLELASGSESQ